MAIVSMWRKRGAAAALVTYVLLVLAISDTDLVLAHLRPVPDRWRGKAVLVTGASSGIGEALALALSAEGAYLVLAARDLGKLKAVQQRLASPEQSAIVQLDMGEPESMPSRAREILAATPAGRLDGFVNNAGISQRESVLTTSYETELRLMTVNHLGPMALTKALLPSLIESGGCILSMNSIAGKIGPPLRSGYAASKHASKGFFESVRADLAVADKAVTLTNVMLGSTNTELPRHALRGDGSPMLDAVVDDNLRRGLAPERVASLALTAAANGVWEAWVARPGVEKHVGLYLSQYAPSLFRVVAVSAAKRHAGRALSAGKTESDRP